MTRPSQADHSKTCLYPSEISEIEYLKSIYTRVQSRTVLHGSCCPA